MIMAKGKRFPSKLAGQIWIYTALLGLLFLTIAPIFIMVISSLKSNAQIRGSFWSLPAPAQWANYLEAYREIWRYILNTVIYAVGASTLVIVLSSLSGYLFAKKLFPGKEWLFMMMLAMVMIPGVLTLIPSYVLYDRLGLTNTPWVIILAHAAGGQIFGTFLCRSFMAGLPDELLEAAKMDGAKEFFIFRKIVIPLAFPALATIFIIQSVASYNDYVWPLLTIRDSSIQMIGVGLTVFEVGIKNMGVQFAAYALSSIPLVLLFAFGMKYYIQGMTQGAIKM